METAIIFIGIGTLVIVTGWTYIFNYEENDEPEDGIDTGFWIIFWLLGKNRKRFRVFICSIGLIYLASGFWYLFKEL